MSTPIDSRVDRLERDVDRVQEQINILHSSSMQLVTTAFTDMERRLGDKIDKANQEISSKLDEQSKRINAIENSYVTRGMLTGMVGFLIVQFLVIIGLGLGLLYEVLSRSH